MFSYKNLYKKLLKEFNKKGLGKRPLLDIFENALNAKENDIVLDKLPKTNLFLYLKIINISKRVLNGYPLEYIFKRSYFFGLELYVNKNTLIPRDETEELVEWVLSDNIGEKLNILDLCSGSGCIGLALKSKRSNWNITGLDISEKANKVARYNAKKLKLDVDFLTNNLLENINKQYDIIVSNPPYIYINDKEVSKSVRKFEPKLALFVDDRKGITIYKRIFDQLSQMNFKKAYFEFGYNQKESLIKLLQNYKFEYEFKKDINNKDRMLKIINCNL